MRVWVYVPDGTYSPNPNVTNASKTEVEVSNLDALLEKLREEAPEGTRVVAFHGDSTMHYVLTHRGDWRPKMQVISA